MKQVRLHGAQTLSTSHAAAASVDVTKVEKMVLDVIRQHGAGGCISEEVLQALPNLGYGSVTPRYRSLLRKNKITVTESGRVASSGRLQRVMVAVDLEPEQQPDGEASKAPCWTQMPMFISEPEVIGQEIIVNGKVWRFDYCGYSGPLWVKKNGEPRKCQTPVNKAVWEEFDKWLKSHVDAKRSKQTACSE